ncbi:hypothetical protein CR513_06435, partial [Mucuna pruriens]
MCKVDSIAYTRLVERGRIFKFLHGLNSKYDPIQVQILGKEKLPFLSKSEETQRSVMLDKGCSNIGSAMVTRKGFTKRSTSEGKHFTKSSHGEYYMYCKRLGHTKDTCYKLYGKEKVLERMGESNNLLNILLSLYLTKIFKPLVRRRWTTFDPPKLNNSKSISILDFEAADHMTPFPSYFTSYLKVSKEKLITFAMKIMFLLLDLTTSNFRPLYPYTINIFRSHCVIQELTTWRTIGVVKEQGGLYYLQHTKVGNNTNKEDLPSSQRATSETWATSQIWLYHKHLGHPLFGLLKTMFSHLLTKDPVESFKCDICQFSKHHRATFSPSNNKSLEPFDLIYSNVWGPTSNSIGGAKWFVSFIDDCTCVTWIFLMKHKSEVCQIFVDFFRFVKNQFGKSIKRLWSYNGTKFVNLEFSNFLKDNSVVYKLTCVNTPQQNGVVERKNYHLLEVARVLLFQMSVPNVYWGEVVLTTAYLINRLLTRVLNDISPIKHMLSFFPNSPLILSLPTRVFGYVAFVHSYSPHHVKLDPRFVKCVFIGYPSNKKGFKCYHPSSRQIFISMDATFHPILG